MNGKKAALILQEGLWAMDHSPEYWHIILCIGLWYVFVRLSETICPILVDGIMRNISAKLF